MSGAMSIGPGLGLDASTGGGNWWIQGASQQLDFVNGRAFGVSSIGSALTIARNTSAYADNAPGGFDLYAANTLRQRPGKGLMAAESQNNLFLNSLTPATQTIAVVNGTKYTVALWASGGTLALSGAGSGTVNPNGSLTFTASGTSLTVTCNGLAGSFQCVNVVASACSIAPIATTGVPFTCAADVITLNNPSSFLSSAQGSVFIEWDELAGSIGTTRFLFSYALDASNRIFINVDGVDNRIHFKIITGNVAQVDMSVPVAAAGQRCKVAVAWVSGRFVIRVSPNLGASPANITSGSIPTGLNAVGIGNSVTSFGSLLNANMCQFAAFLTAQNDNFLNALVA